MKKAMVMILAIMVCLVAYHVWSFADGNFTSGGATITDAVENIDIEWTAGSVTVAYHDEDTVILEESSDRPINGDDRMRWKMDGKTLVIEYNSPVLFRFFTPTKALTVTLPKGISLKKTEISTTSADINIPELNAEEVVFGSTSGDVNATVTAPAVRGESTSGDVILKLNGKVNSVKMGSTSGRLSLALEEAERAELGTTSGGINLEAGSVKRADLGSTSGDINVKARTFEQMKIETTSGGVTAELSADPGFTARVSTLSGDLSSDLALSRKGDILTCGNGSGKLEIGTTSGDIRLAEME